MTTPTEKKAEAREGLMDARSNFATVEALQPREPATELDEAEARAREHTEAHERQWGTARPCWGRVLLDELDRFRAEVARLNEFVRAVRMADELPTGDGDSSFTLAVLEALADLDKDNIAVPPRKVGT
jgi:hypothetical protein